MADHAQVLRAMLEDRPLYTREREAVEAAITSMSAPPRPAMGDDELPGMWEHADFEGGDPDTRSHAERARQAAAPVGEVRERPCPRCGAPVHEWTGTGATAVCLRCTEIAPAEQASAPVGVPVDVVREYLDARACYEAATRPPNSHAPAPTMKHGDPVALRLREARAALDNAIALARQPAAAGVAFKRCPDDGSLVNKQGHRLAYGGVPGCWRVKPEDFPPEALAQQQGVEP